MATDPKYVRLAKRLTRGMWADLDSGFSIAGLDVVPFPEDEDQAHQVRRALRTGVVEVASAAEYELVKEEGDSLRELTQEVEPQRFESVQEHEVRSAHSKAQKAVSDKREEVDPDDDEYELDVERREAVAARAKELGLDSDDPAEQATRGPRTPAKASRPRKAQPKPNDG